MLESLFYFGAGAGAGEKLPGAGHTRTGSTTLTRIPSELLRIQNLQ